MVYLQMIPDEHGNVAGAVGMPKREVTKYIKVGQVSSNDNQCGFVATLCTGQSR